MEPCLFDESISGTPLSSDIEIQAIPTSTAVTPCGTFGVRSLDSKELHKRWRSEPNKVEYELLRLKSTPTTLTHSPSAVKVVDMFSGCGGLSLGAWMACLFLGKRFHPAAALDNDADAIAVYNRNFHCEGNEPCDITDVINGNLWDQATDEEFKLRKRIGRVDLLLAGPPCQGYSDLNNHTRRDDPRNILYERVARFVEVFRPKHVLIENLPAAIHGIEGSVERTIDLLKKLRYRVDDGIVPFADIGVPQRRKRHIVVASKSRNISIDSIIDKYRVEERRTVEWAIKGLEKEQRSNRFNTPSKHSKQNQDRINYLIQNDEYDLPNYKRPKCHQNDHHSYKSMYGRLKWDEPAQTITSGYGSPGQGRYIHPSEPRALTPHEAARLQFFPDFFDFSDVKTRSGLARMIGNAVPMKLSLVFSLELLS